MPDASTVAHSRPAASAALVERATSRNLYRTGLIGVALFLGYSAYTAEVREALHLYQGLAIILLAVFPALRWARDPVSPFPAFEVFMLTSVTTYALPLLSGHIMLRLYPVATITEAAWAVLAFQLAALVGYHAVRAQPRTGRFWREEVIGAAATRALVGGMAVATLYTAIYIFSDWIPRELASVLRAIFFGVATLCTFMLGRRWGEGLLRPDEKTLFAAAVVAQATLQLGSLYLVSSISLLVLALLGYVSGSKRLPLVTMVALFAVLAVLHNGKSAMRGEYWTKDEQRVPTLTEMPAFLAQWVAFGIKPPEQREARDSAAARRLLERTSLFHMMCLVVDLTPSRQPFLDGETYGHVLPQLMPRLLWPNKPLGHSSTHRLSIYYGLQDEETVLKTTIGFGLLTEAYANFGFGGLLTLGALIGAAARVVTRWTLNSPLLSVPGLFMIVLMAWSFATESTLSVWVGSFYQACLAVVALPWAVKKLFG